MDVALNYCSPTVVALIITIVIILASWSDFLEFTVAQFARAATNSERGEREREREREREKGGIAGASAQLQARGRFHQGRFSVTSANADRACAGRIIRWHYSPRWRVSRR